MELQIVLLALYSPKTKNNEKDPPNEKINTLCLVASLRLLATTVIADETYTCSNGSHERVISVVYQDQEAKVPWYLREDLTHKMMTQNDGHLDQLRGAIYYLSGYPVILHFSQFHNLQTMREDKQYTFDKPSIRDRVVNIGERFPDKANLLVREGRKAADLYSTKTTKR